MKTLIVTILLFVTVKGVAQHNSSKTSQGAFIKNFDLKMDTVRWLCEYDNIAWWTSDSVSASANEEKQRLGNDWFCFYRNNLWHAVYGKYDNNSFDMVFHYTVDSANRITRTRETVDSPTLNSYARALVNANNFLRVFPDTQKVKCNQYIKRNDDQTFSVWLLPAFTTNGIAVYGGEFYYLFDESGTKLLSKNEYSIGYRGFKTDPKKEISLNYTAFDEPPLGAVFFTWYYRRHFDKMVIITKKFVSGPYRAKDGYTWIHASREN
ncbi:MAG TPA: hypothetical protein VL098_06920 [Flavipsychrobacter sp.]|nr:hypothetical protein [Flavipsychrobacter sp.]